MAKKFLRMVLILFLGAIMLVSCNQTDEPSEEVIQKAEMYIHLLAEGKFEEAVEYFDETMKAELPPEALEEIWESLLEQVGDFIDQEFDSTKQTGDGYQLVLIDGLFEATDVTFTVTFDENEQIAGFFMK